jgi:hypothetical protein
MKTLTIIALSLSLMLGAAFSPVFAQEPKPAPETKAPAEAVKAPEAPKAEEAKAAPAEAPKTKSDQEKDAEFMVFNAAKAPPTPENAWGAPLMPGSKITDKKETSIIVQIDQPYDKVLAYYREVLKDYRDPRYSHVDFAKERDWADQMYIEDQGGSRWHSIGIMKGKGSTTTIKIVRDNYTWIFSTLLIRFAGVFMILCILWILLNINNAIMKKVGAQPKKA